MNHEIISITMCKAHIPKNRNSYEIGVKVQLIGIVGSGSTTTYAPLIIWDQVEYLAKEEQLVIINDFKRNIKYLGVLRNAKRYEPFLSVYRRTSFVDNPSLVETGTLPHTSAYVMLIGTLAGNEIEEVQLPPNPGSKTYIIESPSDLELNLGEGLIVGKHKYSGIEVPLSPYWLPYHIAIVGATGTGKSRLVKALVDEILSKTNNNVIIFDHTGLDYTTFYENYVIEASEIVLDVSLIADLMIERTGLHPSTYDPYFTIAVLRYIYESLDKKLLPRVLKLTEGTQQSLTSFTITKSIRFEEFLSKVDYNKLMEVIAENPIKWSHSKFKSIIIRVAEQLAKRESVKIRLGVAIDVKLGEEFFNSLSNRTLLPRNVVDIALKNRIVVVDLSTEELTARRYIVTSIINELWKRIEGARQPINTIVVIDEAHNYACRYCGESRQAIARIAREGRKWGLGVILATQRIIDIDPEIRGNINTWFFSKLQTPSDFNELSGYMNLAGISEASLAVLGKREFFVAGLMNPLKVPILLKVKEVQ